MVNKKLRSFIHNKKFIVTAIALLEALVLLYSVTFAWIEGSKNADVKDTNCVVSAGAGLKFTDDYGASISSIDLSLNSGGSLQDCSSVDGRNFFFPTTENLNKASVSFNPTSFREGTDADKNTKYICKEFNVTALDGLDEVPVYIDNISNVSGTNVDAIRISFNFNDGTAPVIIAPGVSVANEARRNQAIFDYISSPVTTSSTAYSMATYYYGRTPLLTLKEGETKKVTVTVWLEGTDSACTTTNYPAESNLSFDIRLTTTESNTQVVTFVDYTTNMFVAQSSYKLYAIDMNTVVEGNYTDATRYEMTKQVGGEGREFRVSIPNGVTDVVFALAGTNGYTNIWAQGSTSLNNSNINTYYAIGQGQKVDLEDLGYWVDSSCTGMLDVYFTDPNKIFVTETTQPYLYAFNNTKYGSDASGNPLRTWAGFQMSEYKLNSLGQQVYRMIVPADTQTIVFNNGFDGNKQTSDITVGNYVTVPSSGVTKVGFYLGNDYSTSEGKDYYSFAPWETQPD